MKLKIFLFSMVATFILLNVLGLASADDDKPAEGWWCETRAGYCYRTKEQCDDSSCHWRKRAWETTWKEDGEKRSQAFETEPMCDRFRSSRTEDTTRCKWTK